MTASSNGPGTDGSDRVVARALVVAPDGNHLGIQDKLAARGYHCTLATSIPESDTSPEGEHPDVVILIGDAADQIKLGSGPQAPIMVIGGEPNAALNVGHLRVVVVDALPLVFNDLELFSRVDSLVRLNTIREELDRRFETMGKFVAQPPALELPAINSNNARIVLVGSDPEMLGHITNILPPGSATTRFDEPYQALAGLTDDPQDMLVVAPGTGDLEDYLELFRGSEGTPDCTICRW